MTSPQRDRTVQSVSRTFEVLEAIGRLGGAASLSEIAAVVGRPAPSVHRLVRTLVPLGYVRQDASRRYALAPGLIRLGDIAARQFGSSANPMLASVVETIGESANMAIMDGTHALYVAQVAGRHALRMFTEVGRQVPLHSTGVGKALLAQLPEPEAAALVTSTGMATITDHTVTEPGQLLAELVAGRALGYFVETGEQEIGVSCVAVPVLGAPTLTAISISAPSSRVTPDVTRRAATALRAAARTMAEQFTAESGAAS